jgi:tetratricopeptide (TPR) repeat protein
VSTSVPEPAFMWLRLCFESGWAFVQGDLQAAERFAQQGFAAGQASGQPDAWVVFGGLMFNIRYLQGRLTELVEAQVRLVETAGAPAPLHAGFRASAALGLIESGRTDEARELALAEDFQGVPWNFLWPLSMFNWADACSRLGLTHRARELYELLRPFSGQLAVSGNTLSGSFDWALGRLATALEWYERAEDHFAQAEEIEGRLGAPLFLARTRADSARMLILRGRPGDLDRARQMLEQTAEVAKRLGAELIVSEVARYHGVSAANA